jgi:hypothetical protein
MDRIKEVKDIKLPVNYVLLEVVKEEKAFTIELPEGAEAEDDDKMHMKVAVKGSKCNRLDVGDLVFKLGHIPSPVIIKDKAYVMTFEDNCFLAVSPDNMDFTEGIEMGV